jgi:hypothetical protein
MLKQMKKSLVILLAVFFVASVTTVGVSAAPQHEGHHGGHGHGGHGHGGHGHGGHNFHNWHEHRHHGHHDHYYGGTYYPDYEWVYNPATLVWDWTYIPGIVVEQPVEVVTTPEVVDYGYEGGNYYGGHHEGHHGGHGGRHGGHGNHN